MFKRKAYIQIKYIFVFRDKEMFRVPESYKINVEDMLSSSSLDGLDSNNTKNIIDALTDAYEKRKNLIIEIKLDNIISRSINIPKWATKELAMQIKNCLGYQEKISKADINIGK